MSQAIIRKAFEVRLKAWADAQTPAIPVAWENVPFTPPEGRYLRAFVIPAPTVSDFMARNDRRYEGTFQVSLCMPIKVGAGSAESLAASLDAYFAHQFVQDGITVWLTRPFSAAAPIQEPDRFVVPVSAAYMAHVT